MKMGMARCIGPPLPKPAGRSRHGHASVKPLAWSLALAAGLTTGTLTTAQEASQAALDQANRQQQADELLRQADESGSDVSPVRRIRDGRGRGDDNDRGQNEDGGDRRGGRQGRSPSIDGSGNNRDFPTANASHTNLARLAAPAYADGISTLAGPHRPSARLVSNQVSAQSEDLPNTMGLTDYLWQWGQFVDHDIDLTDGINPPEPADILVPPGDPWFDPQATGVKRIRLNRSLFDLASGTGVDNPREQINEISGWIDASNVYGSDAERASGLRTLDGTGQLKTSDGNLLPFNTDGLPNAGGESPELFVAGDPRANEQMGLLAMHTLFVREHNRLVQEMAENNPDLSGEQLYQQARTMVIGIMQVITYQEFLPALLGPDALPDYQGYDRRVDSRISNEFSTASYRMGHSLLPPVLLRLNGNMAESRFGHLSLADAFFSPARLAEEGGIEPLLRGLAQQLCQDFDIYVIDEVRNFLFGLPGSGGFDLVSLNIQRGRDHGLPDYNSLRVAMGLQPALSMADISGDPVVVDRLAQTYASPDQIDPWVGGLAEDAAGGGLVGELVGAVIADQFIRLRDGDRYWYTRMLSADQRSEVENTRLADVIRRNTRIGSELGDRDVFRVD